jgi:hypothetical protein|tara:strand:+ start:733 stop:1512 length:780 start_codon:yes stop_codon:yes gene_type:complete
MKKLLLYLSRFHWQVIVSVLIAAIFWAWLMLCDAGQASLAKLEISNYISVVTGLASIVALFCSVSFGFVLFQIQSAKSERLGAYSELKARLHSFHSWLSSLEDSVEKDICMAMVFELEKLDLVDIPLTDYGQEYQEYIKAMDEGLGNKDKREFYLTSILYSGYIEQLLSRLGVISIRQIITKSFLDTLSKGFGLVGGLVLLLFISLVAFDSSIKAYIFSAAVFFCSGTLLLFLEFSYDVYRQYQEEIDFVGPDSESDSS